MSTDEAKEPRSRSFSLSSLKIHYFIGGLCGGVTATLITHPFDLIKLRLAVHDGSDIQGRPRYFGFFHGIKSAIKEGGFRSLYRGASANVTGAGLSWGLYFFLYNTFKYHFQSGDSTKILSPFFHMLCAMSAGMLTLTVANPIWVVKTRLCLTDTVSVPSSMRYSGLRDGLLKLYRYEGLKGLYRGFIPGLWGTSHGAVQFMCYEELKRLYTSHNLMSIDAKLVPSVYICMAASSKLFAVCLTYPYQVVRARLQDQDVKYSGVKDVIIKTYRNERLRGFYKGITANLLKVVPATCITFVVYETVSYSIKS